MLELGWTRPVLRAADPDDVEAIRWAMYGRALQPLIARDFERPIEELEDVDRKVSQATLRHRRRRQIEDLRRGQRAQAQLRELLELDVEDEPESDPGAPYGL